MKNEGNGGVSDGNSADSVKTATHFRFSPNFVRKARPKSTGDRELYLGAGYQVLPQHSYIALAKNFPAVAVGTLPAQFLNNFAAVSFRTAG